MPYKTNIDLPENLKKHLPRHAQDIYKEAFNHAFSEYKDPRTRYNKISLEEVAHKVAWSAVKQKYEKNEETGNWVPKRNDKAKN